MRLGVFGGSFDPPHLGHLILSAEAVEQLELDRLLWVPAAIPPHKDRKSLLSLKHRLDMVEATISHDPYFELSRIDIDRPGPQFTVDTLRLLTKQYPHADLFLIVGGDSLRDLPDWYMSEEILSICSGLGVMRRPQDRIDIEDLFEYLPGIKEKINWIDAPLLEISSHQIRHRITHGQTFRYYVPEGVYRIIQTRGLYRITIE